MAIIFEYNIDRRDAFASNPNRLTKLTPETGFLTFDSYSAKPQTTSNSIMHTHITKLTSTLLLIFMCLLTTQQMSKAQWIDEEKIDYYSSEEQRLKVLSQSLDILEKADFAKDFQLSIEKGDIRFLAIKGAGTIAPGVDAQQVVDAYNDRGQGAKVLKGSNDSMPPTLAKRVAKVARDYMAPYNKLLIVYVAEKNKKSRKRPPSPKRSKRKR